VFKVAAFRFDVSVKTSLPQLKLPCQSVAGQVRSIQTQTVTLTQ